jgi:hypothetical protein
MELCPRTPISSFLLEDVILSTGKVTLHSILKLLLKITSALMNHVRVSHYSFNMICLIIDVLYVLFLKNKAFNYVLSVIFLSVCKIFQASKPRKAILGMSTQN